MPLLATLEGETTGISLNDLFDVNDYLGIKYFGAPKWDAIKKYACMITQKAAERPTIFFIENLVNDYPADYQGRGGELMGYCDPVGIACMGAPAWNTLKNKIDSELLGFSITGAISSAASKVGSAINKTANVVKDVATAPKTVFNKIWTETPLKYTPGGIFVKKAGEVEDKITSPVKTGVQKVIDESSGVMYTIATETPVKYTGTGQLIRLIEKTKEASGVTTKGTAGVYDSPEVEARKLAEEAAKEAEIKKKKAAAAARAWSSAQASANASIEKQKVEKQAAEAAAAAIEAEQEAAALNENLKQTQETLSDKYAPWVLGGCGLLLALAVMKK